MNYHCFQEPQVLKLLICKILVFGNCGFKIHALEYNTA
jgi:hypothetical protein